MRILLDTNVILDLMLERDPWRVEAEAIAQAGADGRLQAHVGASSITDIFYISRRPAAPSSLPSIFAAERLGQERGFDDELVGLGSRFAFFALFAFS